MQDATEFKAHINERIKEIDALYKSVREDYIQTDDEKLFEKFLLDIWEPRCETPEATQKLYEKGKIEVFFGSLGDTAFAYTKQFMVQKLKPKRKSVTPLWFLLYRLAITNENYNMFICPNIFFIGKDAFSFSEVNIIASNCYFIDIDNFETKKPVYNCTAEEIKRLLTNRFPCYKELKPKYILMSGRGLHLYFILEHTENIPASNAKFREWHKNVTKRIIQLYDGDAVCYNLNRNMRVPYSFNRKINIQTRLYRCQQRQEYSIRTLEEVIRKYLIVTVNDVPEKATDNNEALIAIAQPRQSVGKDDRHRKHDNPEKEIVPNKKKANGRNALNQMRKHDLELWLSRNRNIKGRRHKFFLIYISVLKEMGYSKEIIIKCCFKMNWMLKEPFPEIEIYRTVNDKKKYKFKNETIATYLNFSIDDLQLMELAYTDYERERRKALHQELIQERRAERKEILKQEKIERLQEFFLYIKCHPGESSKIGAEFFGISERHFRRLRKFYYDEVAPIEP